jgi:hypothetical protein
MTRFSRLALGAATLTLTLAAAACQTDERTPTAPSVGMSGITSTIGGDGLSKSFSWTGSDGHQYSTIVTRDRSRHFQDGVEYADIAVAADSQDFMLIDGGAIVYDQLLGSLAALPMGIRAGGEQHPHDGQPRLHDGPQRMMLIPCAAEIGNYLRAAGTLLAAAQGYKSSKSKAALALLTNAIADFVGAWVALYDCESSH